MNAITEAELMAATSDPEVGVLRTPPNAAEAEQSVLGALLFDNLCWDAIGDIVRSEDFYRFEHRIIFDAIGAMVAACKPADIITVHDRLQASKLSGAEGITLVYLNALLQSVTTTRNVRRHAELVREKALQRSLIATMDEATTMVFRGEQDPVDMLDAIAQRIDALQTGQLTTAPRTAQSLVVERLDAINDAAAGNVAPGWPTGLRDIDDALNGGLQGGRVYVIAARPSIGKTALALQIGLNRAEAGDGVLVLTQEMPSAECIDRAICNRGGVDYGRMQRNQLSDSDWGGLTVAAERIAQMPLWIDDQAALTLRAIRGKAMSVRRQGIKVLVIDYLQLCSGSGARGVNRNTELEELSRGIKTLAKQLGIAVLLLSQLSREVEKRATPEPTLSDLRDSGAIEQDADVVIALWQARQFESKRIVGATLLKNRQGRNAIRVPLEFHGWRQTWYDSEADISPKSLKGNDQPEFT